MEEVTKTPENGEKTFTQEEVNGIVAERLARDRKNYADYESLKEKAAKFDELEEKNKSDLQKETERAEALQKELDAMKKAESIRSVRENVAKETNVPADLLTGETEEECKAQAEKLIAFAKPNSYPKVKDGGEVTHTGKASTREQFAEWANQVIGG